MGIRSGQGRIASDYPCHRRQGDQYAFEYFRRIEKRTVIGNRRFRIEHAQHISPADIKRFADLKVIASMQPYHAIDDGRFAERLIGPKYQDDLRIRLIDKANALFGETNHHQLHDRAACSQSTFKSAKR